MKKLLFIVTLSATSFMNASLSRFSSPPTISSETKEISVKNIKILKIAATLKSITYSWTSTCGQAFETTFSGDWTLQEMANWISDRNLTNCGVRPSNVILEIDSSLQ